MKSLKKQNNEKSNSADAGHAEPACAIESVDEYQYDLRRLWTGGHETLQTPHATFDGAYEHMQEIKEHFESKDFEVKEVPDGSFYVYGPFGFKRMYYVATRTIEK